MAALLSVSLLKSVDFPTLGRPTIATILLITLNLLFLAACPMFFAS
jgi:hypothetical protein